MRANRDDRLFEICASFERPTGGAPLLFRPPPEWAAAAHAVVVDDTVHYLWGRRKEGNFWVLMHSTAPSQNPADVTHDPRNPVLLPSHTGFDHYTVEYPFPFHNPADGRHYAYYLGRRRQVPKQTGLLVSDGDFGRWTRVTAEPVITADAPHERDGSSHPSVVVHDALIHIVYTGESEGPPVMCHATALVDDPATITKNPANPVFRGSGQDWDNRGVREAELFRGAEFFHILYGGFDGHVWRIGHVRTRDFRTFEPNPANPVFVPSTDRETWDCDGILTPQVFTGDGCPYLLYAGLKESKWQSGLARATVGWA